MLQDKLSEKLDMLENGTPLLFGQLKIFSLTTQQ